MSDVTCRGSYLLGSACGKCSRCEAERTAAAAIDPATFPPCPDSSPLREEPSDFLIITVRMPNGAEFRATADIDNPPSAKAVAQVLETTTRQLASWLPRQPGSGITDAET